MSLSLNNPLIIGDINKKIQNEIGDLQDLETVDKSSLVNALNEALDSTLNGASRDLNNLSTTGTQKLRSLNAYSSEGELLTDADGLADVKNYAHSTFDLSKFTVVGSPNITDDGILSNCDNAFRSVAWNNKSNIKCNFDLTKLSEKSWSISIPFNFNGSKSNGQVLMALATDTAAYGDAYVSIHIGYSQIYWGLPTGKGTSIASNYRPNYILGSYFNNYLDEDLLLTLSFNINTGTYTMKVTLADGTTPQDIGNNWTQTFTPTTENKELQCINGQVANAYLRFASGDGMTENMKGLKIIVDGVPVFSGNKTGIDTIKPDDYKTITTLYAWVYDGNTIYANSTTAPTELYNADGSLYTQSASTWQIVVENDTTYVRYNGNNATYTSGSNITLSLDNTTCDAGCKITDDGILNYATTSRYLRMPFDFSQDHTFEIELHGNNTGTYPQRVINYGYQLYWNNASTVQVYAHSGNTGLIGTVYYNNTIFKKDYTLKLKCKKVGLTYMVDYVINGTVTGSLTKTFESAFSYESKIELIGLNNPATRYIDLNKVKFYDAAGNLVKQPCLKIPYTESGNGKGYNASTGSKVVNAIYRDRVNDMASQFGYANYYTLSDTDFTLPQVELYGLIGQRTLRDSYRNGINYWELYSNRDLEQGGSCTSGVEVTFARPFADTNYVLSVPYSAKSATAFTPTQTGDWIAKGKGVL